MVCRSTLSIAAFFVSSAALAAPAAARQVPQFRADVSQTGDTPFTGTLYMGDAKMRFEAVLDGEPMTLIVDPAAETITMVMEQERMYMTMDVGSAPFTAPGAQSVDPANPCGGGDVTACEDLGTESVNGYSARKWAYTRDGDRETAWIATELRFPVRILDDDGNQTDFTNVTMGAQPAALFEPPAGFTAMDMGGILGGRGRGGAGGFPG